VLFFPRPACGEGVGVRGAATGPCSIITPLNARLRIDVSPRSWQSGLFAGETEASAWLALTGNSSSINARESMPQALGVGTADPR